MTKAANLSALGSNVTTLGNLSSASTLTLQTNSTTALTIDSNQNVGINKVPNAWGSGFKALQISDSTSIWTNPSTSTTYLSNNLYYDGSVRKYITSNYAGEYQINTGGYHVWFNAPSGSAGGTISLTEVMRITSTGNLQLSTADAGIVFNKTGALTNSILNDYETGTWTPVLNRTTTSPTVTYAIQRGNYVKVGKLVFINVEIQITGVSAAGSGFNTVSGFPFAMSSTNTSWYDIGGNVRYNTIFSSGIVTSVSGGAGQGNAATGFLAQTTANTSEVGVNYQSGYLTFSATYIAAS